MSALFAIELGQDGDRWQARVTVHGIVRHRTGFPICGDAYSWAMRQYLELAAP